MIGQTSPNETVTHVSMANVYGIRNISRKSLLGGRVSIKLGLPRFFAEMLETCSKIPHRLAYIRRSCRKRQFLRIGHLCARRTISHGVVIAAGKAMSHRRFVRRAVRGSGQQILSRIASLTDVAAYSIRSMIRHQTRDNALMSSSSSTKRIESGWNRSSPVGRYPIVSRWPFHQTSRFSGAEMSSTRKEFPACVAPIKYRLAVVKKSSEASTIIAECFC
jgi:hypothetical protein